MASIRSYWHCSALFNRIDNCYIASKKMVNPYLKTAVRTWMAVVLLLRTYYVNPLRFAIIAETFVTRFHTFSVSAPVFSQ